MPVDYHIHLERGPFSLEYLREFVDAAAERGIQEIGFSEHPYRFLECRRIYPSENPWVDARCGRQLEEYVRLVEEAKDAGLPVKLGMEWDYIPGHEEEVARLLDAYPWDYAIGSVHWLRNQGRWWAVDDPHEGEWEKQDPSEVYRQYFHHIEAAAASGLFDVIGHLDLVKIFGHRPTEDLTALYEEVARTLGRAGVCVEVSSAGWYKPVGEVYPGPELLGTLARFGVPVVPSSDAHEPGHVGRDFGRVLALIRTAGYTHVWTFSGRRRSPLPIP
jgi:histidinol-phosphatase (PHP family)